MYHLWNARDKCDLDTQLSLENSFKSQLDGESDSQTVKKWIRNVSISCSSPVVLVIFWLKPICRLYETGLRYYQKFPRFSYAMLKRANFRLKFRKNIKETSFRCKHDKSEMKSFYRVFDWKIYYPLYKLYCFYV